MRRPTRRLRKWLSIRSRNEKRRRAGKGHQVPRGESWLTAKAWTGSRVIDIVVRERPWKPPSILCFDENPDETLAFLSQWRDRQVSIRADRPLQRSSWLSERRDSRGFRQISSYADYSGIRRISTAAAIVIAADYDRLAQLLGSAPPTINLHRWSEAVFSKFYELGFFDLVGLTDNLNDLYTDHENTRTMTILSGTNAGGTRAVEESLLELSKLITEGRGLPDEVIFALNTALSEAMANVARWAYPEDYVFRYRHVGKWWVTAEVDRVERILTIVIYDQGATIPVTLPKQSRSDKFRNSLSKMAEYVSSLVAETSVGEFESDSAYISFAMDEGHSRSEEPNRGYGIPQMKDLISVYGRGRLSIMSRNGRCVFDPRSNLGTKRTTLSHSIGGTLIEWVIEIPEGPSA